MRYLVHRCRLSGGRVLAYGIIFLPCRLIVFSCFTTIHNKPCLDWLFARSVLRFKLSYFYYCLYSCSFALGIESD